MPTTDKIKVLYVQPGKDPREIEIKNKLKALQEAVGGYIEATYPYKEPVALLVNEEGKTNQLPYNRTLRDEYNCAIDDIFGDFLVVGIYEEDICSLTPLQIARFKNKFKLETLG